jgi:hypothetical protein
MARLLRQRPNYLALFLMIVLYFWGMSVMALSILRMSCLAMAFLLIPAAAVPARLVLRNNSPRAL